MIFFFRVHGSWASGQVILYLQLFNHAFQHIKIYFPFVYILYQPTSVIYKQKRNGTCPGGAYYSLTGETDNKYCNLSLMCIERQESL